MDRIQLIRKYKEFFALKEHSIIPGASLIPENDPTVLFTTAGMHPLVPYILGGKHPAGKRLVNVQPCIRTGDIDSVGDESHLTFFEMLGNWSLGDYWKKEAIEWSFEFLTKHLGFRPEQLHVTVFSGEAGIPKDDESAKIWESLGIPQSRIIYLGMDSNFWGPAGLTGPCGPCTEMFIDTGKNPCGNDCRPGCSCGKYFEIWNDVFMQYRKTESGIYEQLAQRNVDTGMGVERTIAMLEGKKSVYDTEIFLPIIEKIKSLSTIKEEHDASVRIIADHAKAAVFILGDSHHILPGKKDQSYVLRRLIRKAVRHGNLLDIEGNFLEKVAGIILSMYQDDYPLFRQNRDSILETLQKEEELFRETLEGGLKILQKEMQESKDALFSGKTAFLLYQSYGFPVEMTKEILAEHSRSLNESEFDEELSKHQELSRVGSEKKFKGGLADTSEISTKYHTATHLLHQALRTVLGTHVQQKGSNITAERLRFDFSHDKKMTPEEIKEVEELINAKIAEELPVTRREMSVQDAIAAGALAFFGEKYGEKVSVYSVGDFSKEFCGGPHVQNTKELGEGGKKFRIVKEEAVSAGVRRIKAVLE